MAENRSIFYFKEFQLAHGNPGLKISTEACLFGAWASNFAFGKILDIGTGCGLLACMLAQKQKSSDIDAIEIQTEVANIARENCKKSPFEHQINVILGDIKDYKMTSLYSFIISNPPFFSQHLAAENHDKHISIHDDLLGPKDLAKSIQTHLAEDGKFSFIYPPTALKKFEEVIKASDLHINHLCDVYSRPGTPILRNMVIGSRKKMAIEKTEIFIKDEQNEYSKNFKNLLTPYYLIFE